MELYWDKTEVGAVIRHFNMKCTNTAKAGRFDLAKEIAMKVSEFEDLLKEYYTDNDPTPETKNNPS